MWRARSADVVLTDDDFSTIVRAIAEGRTIYANLRKVIHFLFSCNLSEILTILIAIAAGFPLRSSRCRFSGSTS